VPLVAAAVLAYATGLLLGFGGAAAASGVVALAAVAGGAWRRDARLAALGLLLGAGAATAWATARHDAACALRLARAPRLTITFNAPVGPGGFVDARAAAAGCESRASVSVARGRAQGGDVADASGLVVPGARGVLVRYTEIGDVARRAPLVAWRDRAGRSIDGTFRADAPLARALLIADTRSLPPEIRDRFAAAGLVHVLSISGLHVAIVAGAMQLLLVAAGVPRQPAMVGAVVATTLYVAVIGAPPPAVRSGTMLAALALSRLLQRPTSPWATLASGAALPLVLDERTALDLGFQLSVAGIAALVASASLSRRLLEPRAGGWRLSLARELLTSVVASVVTLPLVLWTFGRVSLVAPIANLAAGPVVAVLQPTLFLALLCAPAPPVARFVADAAHPLLALLDAIAAATASVPHAAVWITPTLGAAWACGVAAVAVVVACVSRHPGPPVVVGSAAVAVIAWLPLLPSRVHGAELHMIDVGQGDALALRTPRGRWVLFDAGREWSGGDAGRSAVIPYLRRHGGEVVAFVLSHPHADHVGGASSVLRALRPRQYWDAAFAGGSDAYRRSLETARVLRAEWRRVHAGDSLVVDGVRVRFLAPDSAWTVGLRDPNEASTVALVSYGAVRFLLVGDAERAEEDWLARSFGGDLRADVLKVGHHGSSTSSSARFLDLVRPRLALVSVGLGNSYGHPSADVLRALADAGAEVVRTDLSGSAVVRTDGRRITVLANGVEWPLAPESSDSSRR
jgi:competence protein ComEC